MKLLKLNYTRRIIKNELFRRGFNSRHLHPHTNKYKSLKTILSPSEINLIDENGKQIGIVAYDKALGIAKERGFDLVIVTNKTDPPVYKLGDYNKIKYEREKKYKLQKFKERQAAPKSIRIGFNESSHDLLTKVKKIEEFLNDDRIVNIEMRLRGREKAHGDLARSKIEDFLSFIKISFKIIQPLKRYPQGFIVTLKKN